MTATLGEDVMAVTERNALLGNAPATGGLDRLVRLRKSQVRPAADVLARAFQYDPMTMCFFPDAPERAQKLPHVFRMFVHYGVRYGEVYGTSVNIEAAAIWLPSERGGRSVWGMMLSGGLSMMLRVGIGDMVRMMRYNVHSTAMHRRHAPARHWYLQCIGADPMYQSKGHAGALLKPMCARMDLEHSSCYLTTHNRENVAIYQHYGFAVVEQSMIPRTETRVWAMLRRRSS